ncbi:hypothetical protein KCU95_g6518, partial [Aureobasidium melanogenum]
MRTAFFVSALASTAFAGGIVTQISDGQIQAPVTEAAPSVVASAPSAAASVSSAVESVSSAVVSSVVASSISSAVESSAEVAPVATSSALSTRMPVPIINATTETSVSAASTPAAVVPSAGVSTALAGGNSTNGTVSSQSLKASSTLASTTKAGSASELLLSPLPAHLPQETLLPAFIRPPLVLLVPSSSVPSVTSLSERRFTQLHEF